MVALSRAKQARRKEEEAAERAGFVAASSQPQRAAAEWEAAGEKQEETQDEIQADPDPDRSIPGLARGYVAVVGELAVVKAKLAAKAFVDPVARSADAAKARVDALLP